MTRQELHEKYGLKEYHVVLTYPDIRGFKDQDGNSLNLTLGFDTVQATKSLAEAEGIRQAVSLWVQLKDIISIEVEEKKG